VHPGPIGPSPGPPKREVAELALFGGPATFPEPLHVGRPNVGDRERLFARLSAALDRRVLSNGGPLVEEFEQRVASLVGARHVLAVSNATIGLQIAALAVGLEGEVIVPAFTFVATAHALDWVGIAPVFCDIHPETLTIDPAQAEAAIGGQTSGILGVHLWGRVCDTSALEDLAQRRSLSVIYDAAHALGCGRSSRMVGTFGAAEVFSFHATKFVNAFEGGAIATNDYHLAGRLSELRNFGFLDNDHVVGRGTNGKMSEASAAMGLTSLDAMPSILATNLANAERYEAGLRAIEGIRLLTPDREGPCNAQHVVVRLDERVAGIRRDDLLAVLQAENVLARRYFHPGVHRMQPYASRPGGPPHLPVTEALASQVLVLPTGTAVGPLDIDALSEVIRFTLRNASQVRRRLDSSSPGSLR
jgi:dTDP-4-amino-4,6-dideoxygalactose transaminase